MASSEKRSVKTLIFALVASVAVGLGLSWAGGDNGAQVGPISLFALCGLLAFVINWAAYIPAMIAKTERYYDLVGSLTYLTVIAVALCTAPALDSRSKIVAFMVALWALRLGTFLFMRIRKDGHDDRFDEIKVSPLRFSVAWTMQGLWVLFTVACALAIITSTLKLPLGTIGFVGIFVWVVGFLIEVIADAQKRSFKRDPNNEGKFINTGLWAWSRHPNYFGEITLWSGVAILAVPVLQGFQWATLISPVFVYLLLTRVSGIPTLEEKAKKRWSDDQDYKDYVENTTRLLPLPPSKS